MVAAIDLRNMTSAEETGSVPAKSSQRECYAPTEPVSSSSLVFLGPRMQIQLAILFGQRRYVLNDMFVIDLDYMEDAVFASHRTLPVTGYGGSQREALDEFEAAFDFQWRNLVEVAPEALTPGALKAREAMMSVVSRVEPVSPPAHGA